MEKLTLLSYHRFNFFSVLRSAFARKLFKKFVKMAKVVKSAFVTGVGNAYRRFAEQFAHMHHTILIYKMCKSFMGSLFKISAKCGYGHVGHIGYLA